MYSGSFTGQTYVYNNIDNNLLGNFDSLTILNFNEGRKNMIAIEDINNDQKPDLLIGNFSGGLSFFSSDSVIIVTSSLTDINNFNIYPNPTERFLTIDNNEIGSIVIINNLGQIILKDEKLKKRKTLNLDNLKTGIYIIKFKNQTSKLIIK